MLKIRHIDHYGFPILHVAGNLDLTTFGKLLTEIGHRLERHPRVLGLDFSEVSEADTAAVNVVATAAEWMAAHGGRLRLLDTSPAFDRAAGENAQWLRPRTHLDIYHRVAS